MKMLPTAGLETELAGDETDRDGQGDEGRHSGARTNLPRIHPESAQDRIIWNSAAMFQSK